MSFLFRIVFALCICLRFGFAASLAVDGLCCVTRSGRWGDWLSPSLLPFLPLDIKLCIEYENTLSLSELRSTTEPVEKCRNDNNWLLWGKWRKRGLLKTADNWIGANRREPQALSHKPSFSRPIQSDPSLSPPNTIQANPIRTKIVSAAYLDFEPAVKLCLHTVQFRSRSSEIWWLTTNCTAERVPLSSSVMAVWGLWDSTKVKPILGLGNEYNCERIFYMWRKRNSLVNATNICHFSQL